MLNNTAKLSLFERIEQYCMHYNLIKPHTTIVVGLSGGPDSVFLLYFLYSIQTRFNLTLIAAHVDHQWRSNSAQDVIFCQQLAQSLGITFISAQASSITLTRKHSSSKEELGRLLRRAFFQELACKYNAHAIALAHHADDQQETFFIRLIRGTTLSGLTSIWPKYDRYIRPLLNTHKTEILAYLQEQSLNYLEDPTNQSDLFLRNRLRTQVLPILSTIDTRFDKNFAKTVDHLQNTELFLERLTQQAFNVITTQQDNLYWLDIDQFFGLDSFLHNRLLLMWLCKAQVPFTPSTSLFKEITRFLSTKQAKRHTMYQTWVIIRDKNKAAVTLL